jgi:hypothetical protein
VFEALGAMKLTEAQFIRAMYSAWDFQQALSALTFLLQDCDFEVTHAKVELRRFRCYETNVIISFCRPFEDSRGGTTLGLRALGIVLSPDEKSLKDKLLSLRRKIVAHSDEEEMHFRVDTHSIEGIAIPHFQYDEGLHLSYDELDKLEDLLRKLRHKLSEFFFSAAQDDPNLLNKYKTPSGV